MRFLFLPKKPLRVRRMLNRAVTESLVILVPKAKRILISVHGNKIMADVNNFIAPRSQYTHTQTKWLWRCHADLIWNWPKLLFNRRVYDMNRMKLCSVCHLNMLLTFLPARLCVCVYRPNGSHGWQGSFSPQHFFSFSCLIKSLGSSAQVWPFRKREPTLR